MSISRASRLQTDLKPRSVRQFLNIPAEIVHKDDRMAGSHGILTGTKTSGGGSLRELFHFYYRAVKPLTRSRSKLVVLP
jgi:hypothetical protein